MGKRAKNFRAWKYQNPNGTPEEAWDASWNSRKGREYSLTIQGKNAQIRILRNLLTRVLVSEGRCQVGLLGDIRAALNKGDSGTQEDTA